MNSRLVWLWALCVMVALGGCGGGKKSAAAFSANTTAVVKSGGAFNQLTSFEITGTGLRNTLIDASFGCADDFILQARVDTVIRVTCTVTGIDVRFTLYDATSDAVAVVSTSIPRPTLPYAITAITPGSTAKLGKSSEFTVTGTNLFSGLVKIEATGCSNVSQTDISDDNLLRIQKITCLPTTISPAFKVIALDTDTQIGSDFQTDFTAMNVADPKAEASAVSVNGVPNTYTVRGYFYEASDVSVTSSKCATITDKVFNAATATLRFSCTPNGDLDTTFEVTNQDDELVALVPLPIRIAFGFALGNSTALSYRVDVDLDYENAPDTVTNFLQYVDSTLDSAITSYFADTLIHRMELQDDSGYSIIQGGAFTSKANIASGTAKTIAATTTTPSFPLPPIPLEASAVSNLSHVKGTIAMARTSDPNSASSQFFFNVTDNSSVFDSPPQSVGYAVFGKVVDTDSSQANLEGILGRPLTPNSNVPLEDIRIINVLRIM